MVGLGVGDDWMGIKNTELGGLVIRGDEPAIWECEPLSKLVKQSTKGGSQLLSPSSYGEPLTLYSSL